MRLKRGNIRERIEKGENQVKYYLKNEYLKRGMIVMSYTIVEMNLVVYFVNPVG
jgi:hypothetical protein